MKHLLITLALLAATSLHAGDGSVSLSPAVIMLRGEAGQSTTQTFLLRNGTSRALSFDVLAQDVVVRDGKRVMLDAGAIPGSIAATAVFSQRRVKVAPGERIAVTATFTIPPKTSTRAVIALFRGTDKIKTGSMTASASLGSLLTFALSNETALTADALRVQPPTATSNLAIAQTCTNSGSEPLVAKGMIAVIGADGRIAGKSALQPRRLLPGERAQLDTRYGADLKPGRYRVLVTYDYEGRALTQSTEITVR